MRSRRSVAARGWYQDVERFRVWMSEYIRGYKESMKRKKKHKKKKTKQEDNLVWKTEQPNRSEIGCTVRKQKSPRLAFQSHPPSLDILLYLIFHMPNILMPDLPSKHSNYWVHYDEFLTKCSNYGFWFSFFFFFLNALKPGILLFRKDCASLGCHQVVNDLPGACLSYTQ